MLKIPACVTTLCRASTCSMCLGLYLGGCAQGDETISFDTPDPPPATATGGTGNAGGAGGSEAADAGNYLDHITATITDLHVEGNRIKDAKGEVVPLRGVNRSGTEYSCSQGRGFFDGPDDDASLEVMKTWNITAVRVPLNESCWLGINGVRSDLAGDNYKLVIQRYVKLLYTHNIVPILDLHWVGPGENLATRLQPLPDADHAPAFWHDVALTFKDDTGVIFEVFNEPFPDGNRDSQAAWQCWRDGCTSTLYLGDSYTAAGTYEAVGVQSLVDVIRATGSKNLILLGGVQYSNALSRWLEYKPIDPLNNLAAAWHIYNFNACASNACWDNVPATLATTHPIVVTEFGGNDCTGNFVTPLMQWLEQHGLGYLGWTWSAWGACVAGTSRGGGSPWALITDYATGTPNSGYAQAIHDQYVKY